MLRLALIAAVLSTVTCTASDDGRQNTVAADSGAASATPQTDRRSNFPLSQVRGAEKVTLIRVYRISTWEPADPGAATYIPDDAHELIVVRFFRESLEEQQDLPDLKVVLLDTNAQQVERLENLRRAVFAPDENWAEFVFVASKGARFSAVLFNEMRFDIEGLEIPSEAVPAKT